LKHVELRSFARDWSRLSRGERARFLKVLRGDFQPACERFSRDPATPWPASLRIKSVQGARGIWEMTWSFTGPDGRATFEWIEVEGGLAIRWRRIGGHEIFGRP
jgi:hypothetical protein